MNDNVIPFPEKKVKDDDPILSTELVTISIMGNGDVSVWVHDFVETRAQFNWLFAHIAQASAALLHTKADRTDSSDE